MNVIVMLMGFVVSLRWVDGNPSASNAENKENRTCDHLTRCIPFWWGVCSNCKSIKLLKFSITWVGPSYIHHPCDVKWEWREEKQLNQTECFRLRGQCPTVSTQKLIDLQVFFPIKLDWGKLRLWVFCLEKLVKANDSRNFFMWCLPKKFRLKVENTTERHMKWRGFTPKDTMKRMKHELCWWVFHYILDLKWNPDDERGMFFPSWRYLPDEDNEEYF